MPYFMKMISNDSNLFDKFAKDPDGYLKQVVNNTKMFDPVFNLLNNGMFCYLNVGVEQPRYQGFLPFCRLPYIKKVRSPGNEVGC